MASPISARDLMEDPSIKGETDPILKARKLLDEGARAMEAHGGGPISPNTAAFFMHAATFVEFEVPKTTCYWNFEAQEILFECGDFFWEHRRNCEPDIPLGTAYWLFITSAQSYWRNGLERARLSHHVVDVAALERRYGPLLRQINDEQIALWFKEHPDN